MKCVKTLTQSSVSEFIFRMLIVSHFIDWLYDDNGVTQEICFKQQKQLQGNSSRVLTA